MSEAKKKRTTKTKSSPTKLTLAHLRSLNYTAQVVEHWNAFAKRRIDLFECIDVVALNESYGCTVGIQATSRANVSARIAKIKELPAARTWLACGNKLEVWGWDKRDGRNRLLTVTLGDAGGAVVEKSRFEPLSV